MRNSQEIIATILDQRGIALHERDAFLHPNFERDTHDPMLLKDMVKAVERLAKARECHEKVIIFGDYDADGIPAVALLVRTLRALGLEIKPLIPARADGYGLTTVAVAAILQENPDVIITVDNGTVSRAEVAELSKKADIIIIDHHEINQEHLATDAYALINPKQADCAYPFKELCACALAWKTVVALTQYVHEPWEPLKWQLDLVALSTIADLVPLTGENRVLVVYGLQVMAKSRNLGLQTLAGVAGFNLQAVSAGDVGFKVAPRINAPSRMHLELVNDENAALKLLITENVAQATELATYLNQQNQERQALVEAHLEEAYTQAEAQAQEKVLVVFHQDWSTGVIGLVASRLTEKYKRPSIVLAPEGKEIKGSMRSVGNLEALAILGAGDNLLERYGGHAKAAGLTLKSTTMVSEFQKVMHTAPVLQTVSLESITQSAERHYDLCLHLAEANLELALELEKLAPFGMGFAKPLFATDALITSPKKVGKLQQHLSCFLEAEGVKRKAIAFRQGEVTIPDELTTITFHLEAETWNEVASPVCTIEKIN